MDSLEYEVLSYLEAGRSMFRPRNLSARRSRLLSNLWGFCFGSAGRGSIEFTDGRIFKTAQGTYLAVGPVDLTEAGQAALARERRLGERPGRTYDRLWRLH
jgi:hypothetical protein